MKALALSLIFLGLAQAQSFDKWFDDLIEKQRVAKNGAGAERQRDSSSADPRSTSLVDQSSATDFISVATSLVPVPSALSQAGQTAPSGGNTATGSTTVTASLYALMATLNHVKPTDPDFYRKHVDARRLSLTVGTAASKVGTDNTDKAAEVIGAKFLIVNHRELYTASNLKIIGDVQNKVTTFAAASARMKDRIQLLMFESLHPEGVKSDGTYDTVPLTQFLTTAFSAGEFPNTLKQLPASAISRIEEYVRASSGPYAQLKTTLDQAYDEISKAGQFSISYTANIRPDMGNNYHRAEIIYDYGVSQRILWTVNASADYTDRKSSVDSRGGRIATEFQGDLTKPGAGFARLPMRLSFSGEAKWMTKEKPQYTFQAKLSVPIVAGVELPLVYRYANPTAQIKSGSEARLGLSFDVMRLAAALK